MRDADAPVDTLWWLVVSPVIWAVHFLLSYISAAIWCAKLAGPDLGLGPVRGAIAVYTVLALIGVGLTGYRGWRGHSFGSAAIPHDFDTPEDRHRFIGLAVVLLSSLSAVGIAYAALAPLFIGTCQ